MNAESFCYWLQGFFEVSQIEKIDEKQVQIIKDHLKLVFEKKTPNYDYFMPLSCSNGIVGTNLRPYTYC